MVLVIIALAIPYRRLSRRVDLQLSGNVLNTVNYYSASEIVAPGDPMTASDLAAAIKRSGDSVAENDRGLTISGASRRKSACQTAGSPPSSTSPLTAACKRTSSSRSI